LYEYVDKNIVIEYKRKLADLIVCGPHSGTVDTELSKSLQKNAPPEELFTPELFTKEGFTSY